MMAINLYLTYLGNSVLGMSKSDKLLKLEYERKKIIEIINELDSLFENDPSISDKKNHSIYVVIKRNIISEVFTHNDMEVSICSCKMLLMDVVGNIDSRLQAISA